MMSLFRIHMKLACSNISPIQDTHDVGLLEYKLVQSGTY